MMTMRWMEHGKAERVGVGLGLPLQLEGQKVLGRDGKRGAGTLDLVASDLHVDLASVRNFSTNPPRPAPHLNSRQVPRELIHIAHTFGSKRIHPKVSASRRIVALVNNVSRCACLAQIVPMFDNDGRAHTHKHDCLLCMCMQYSACAIHGVGPCYCGPVRLAKMHTPVLDASPAHRTVYVYVGFWLLM